MATMTEARELAVRREMGALKYCAEEILKTAEDLRQRLESVLRTEPENPEPAVVKYAASTPLSSELGNIRGDLDKALRTLQKIAKTLEL